MRKLSFYNWNEIQIFYDENHTWSEITNQFGVSPAGISSAIRSGLFKSRSNSQSQKLRIRQPLSLKTKEKLSIFRKQFLLDNPEKAPYRLNHYSKGPSYAEKYWTDVLTNNEIAYEPEFQVGLYSLDFKIGMIDLEIDGEQHYVDPRIVESDKRRTEYLESLGYTVLRIRWSEFQRKSLDKRKEFVSSIIDQLIA
jgi:very-short-patch-repair endonuclease